jgi:hypothetical protein
VQVSGRDLFLLTTDYLQLTTVLLR